MLAFDPQAIEIDSQSGTVRGAGRVERLGIAVMRGGEAVLRPFGRFGMSRVVRGIATVLPGNRPVRVRLAPDAVFEMPYGDPYWTPLLSRSPVYEAGVAAVLRAVADDDFAFVDCGANYGYWSVLVSSQAFGSHPTVAIEASAATVVRLRRNAANNGDRFAVIHAAVSDRSGVAVAISGARHEARMIAAAGSAGEAATTLRLDDLLGHGGLAEAESVVVKLDVEGAEAAALAGADRLLAHDGLVIYEDHGSDRSHAVSHAMRAAGMTLYRVDGAAVRPVGDIAELTAVKRRRRWGYEFFATRSPKWRRRLEGLKLAT